MSLQTRVESDNLSDCSGSRAAQLICSSGAASQKLRDSWGLRFRAAGCRL